MFATTLPESYIKGLSIKAKELHAVNLGQGIPSFPTPVHIVEAARVALSDPTIGVYPNFLGEIRLRTLIARRLTLEHTDQNFVPEQILITVGAMEGTAASIFSVVRTGERVAIITPDYCNHVPQVMLAKGEVAEVPMRESGGHWELDRERLTDITAKPCSMIIFTNPSNPTGAVLTQDDLVFLVDCAKKANAWLVADETYNFLTYDVPFVSMLSFLSDYDRILVVRSFSKEYAMTGWRVGYVVSAAKFIGTLAKTHDALTGCVPKISQRAAIEALSGPQDIVDEFRRVYVRRRVLALDGLKAIPGLTLSYPLGAYYAFPGYAADIDSMSLSQKLLTEAGVAVIPGKAFGEGGEKHFRISFAVEDAVLLEGLARLKAYFVKKV